MSSLASKTGKRPLRVMKFGGTSVGDASSIRRVADIIRGAAQTSDLVVVVSAMGGVTNKLIEAATQSEAGNRDSVEMIFEELRDRHQTVVRALIQAVPLRSRVSRDVELLFQEGERLCQGTALLRELTLRARDSISSLGERLSAPIVAAALAECGVASEAIEATEVIQTDSCYGSADPCMDVTQERCQAHLRPMLKKGIVPVVTGFIGATADGVLTTLGRGGSDYSATIVAAALGADEVVIWTDVDGLMTADPRLVEGARTIAEISYREAAELAHFGAKVLHPKTLRAITQCAIPLWIRNTFAPERPGTRVTPAGLATVGGVKGLTAIRDVALITVGGPDIVGLPDVLGRTFATAAAVRSNVLLISQSSAQNDICFIMPSATARHTVDALRREFAQDLAHQKVEHITYDPGTAVVTVVGKDMRRLGIAGRIFTALAQQRLDVFVIAQGSSDCNISFVIAQKDMSQALVALHREFQLGVPLDHEPPAAPHIPASNWYYEPERPVANGD